MPFTCYPSLRFLSIEAAWQFGIIKIDFAEGYCSDGGVKRERKD